MSNPVAVLISDVHFNVHTIKLATAALEMAVEKANDLEIPLIVAGDLHDTKANLRGECVNAMIKTFQKCVFPPFVIVGNHDRINEKSPEHSLEFLKPYANLVDKPLRNALPYLTVLPYYHDTDELRAYLKTLPKGSTLIMHQGLNGSASGDYFQDKSAINHEDVADFRVISGHYHTRQSIKTGRPQKGAVGLFDYIGNPFTLNFGEANDPEKGLQILMDDGTLEFIPTNLRKHIIIEMDSTKGIPYNYNEGDLLWIKLKAKKEDLYAYNRGIVAKMLNIEGWPFKLDLIPTDTTSQTSNTKNLTQGPLLDSIIDDLNNTSDDKKSRLKDKWKQLCE